MPVFIADGVVASSPGQGKSKKARRRARRRASRASAAPAGQVLVVGRNPPPRQRPARRNSRPRGGRAAGVGGNPYLATLLEPDSNRGVKIPDPITLASSTWTYESDTTQTCDTNGATFVAFVPIAAANSQGSAIGNVAYAGGGSTGTLGFQWNGGTANPNIAGIMGRIRCVSAEVIMYSTTSPLNTTGRACTFQIPAGTTLQASLGSNTNSGGNTFSGFTGLPYSFVDHFAQGAIARFAPSDPTEYNYQPVGSSTVNGYTVASGVLTAVGPGSMIGIAVFGAGSGTVVATRIVANYEFLPQSDATDFVNRELSPWRQDWIDQANAFIQRHADTFLKVGRKALGIGAAALETVLPGVAGLSLAAKGVGALSGMLRSNGNMGSYRDAGGFIPY